MLLADVIQRDTRANQPAATAVADGTLYYVTDENVTERSNGSAWQDYSDAGATPTAPTVVDTITAIFDGGGSVLTTKTVYVQVPYACTVTGWRIVADVSGSAVVGVWKDTYANYPPVVGDSIAGSEKPTLSGAQKNEDTTLSTWTTSISAGDYVAFNLESGAATVTWLCVQLLTTRTL
jgi:hypothetical protein